MSLSKCCKAPISPMGSGDRARWHMCNNCKLATDPIPEIPPTPKKSKAPAPTTRPKRSPRLEIAWKVKKVRRAYLAYKSDLLMLARHRAYVGNVMVGEGHVALYSMIAKQDMVKKCRRLIKGAQQKKLK